MYIPQNRGMGFWQSHFVSFFIWQFLQIDRQTNARVRDSRKPTFLFWSTLVNRKSDIVN